MSPALPALKRVGRALRDDVIRIRKKVLFEAGLEALSGHAAKLPLTYRFGTYAEIAALTPALHEYDEEAKRLAWERLQVGDQVVLGDYQRQVVFYGWLMFGAIEVGHRRWLRTSPQRVYSYKLFTTEPFRGNGALPGFYAFIAPTLAAQGYRQIACWISQGNRASVRSHERCGFSPSGSAYEVRLLSRSVYLLSRTTRRRLCRDA